MPGASSRRRDPVPAQVVTPLRLVKATEADLPFVMATERREGYGAFVGRWDEARHRAALADPTHAYFIGMRGTDPVGFVIVQGWNSPDRVSTVRRIAVCDPGQGQGRELLRAVVETVFGETAAHRLWLGVFPENARARRAYEAVGFVAEGISRGSAFSAGIPKDQLVMSILRPEWPAAPGEVREA